MRLPLSCFSVIQKICLVFSIWAQGFCEGVAAECLPCLTDKAGTAGGNHVALLCEEGTC